MQAARDKPFADMQTNGSQTMLHGNMLDSPYIPG